MNSFLIQPEVEEYVLQISGKEAPLLRELREETHKAMDMPQMLTGPVEGAFLKFMIRILGAKRVLEVGTFTGYGTLNMAEAIPEDGEVLTCEFRDAHADFAQKYFDRSPHGGKIKILRGPAVANLVQLAPSFDFVFVDADKTEYPKYYEEGIRLLRVGGVMVLDNALRHGTVLDPQDEAARVLNQLNQRIAKDDKVESVLLTVRDGLHLIRKVS